MQKSKYKIIAIAQVYNELEKDNLKRFIKYLTPLVGNIVFYDDGSTDGTYEYLLQKKFTVIRGARNEFKKEIQHKKVLLEKALTYNPDFILWLDADEVLTRGSDTILQKWCSVMTQQNIDGLSLHEINLWRSATWQRIDSLYDIGWFVRLWRVTPELKFTSEKTGLHQSQYPSSIKKIVKTDELSVIHYGFSSDKHLAYKYLTYRSHGQRGYDLLDRLISEDQLELKKVLEHIFPEGLYTDEEKPIKRDFVTALSIVDGYKPQVFRPKYSIVCLIYKSTQWLQFVYEQVLKYTNLGDTEFFFVANDATDDVRKYLKDNYIPHYIYENSDEHKKEWYINNVYRAWNFAAKKARGDFIIFINSDMAFAPGWLDRLLEKYDGTNCITSRLVESGKLKSGTYGIEKNFGRSVTSYKEKQFQDYVVGLIDKTKKEFDLQQADSRMLTKTGGLFMPLLVRREHFLSVGGYPEGNIVPGTDISNPEIAKHSEPCVSGDVVLMEKLKTRGIKHQTAFDSIIYHFQEGEMDAKEQITENKEIKIAIINDLVAGTLGEKVLWEFMLEKLPGAYGVDKRVVGSDNFEKEAKKYIGNNYPNTKIIIQNASFINYIDPSRYTIVFLQDNLRAMQKKSSTQEKNLKKADLVITNSLEIAYSYDEFDMEIIPIGVNHELFKPMNKEAARKKAGLTSHKKIGIFVGDLSEVKGWEKIEQCIEINQDIFWIIVTKDDRQYKADNAVIYHRIPQKQLAVLLNAADFFILGSSIETQCLAAIEAGLCNVPIIMRPIGIFSHFSEEERSKIGIFGDDFQKATSSIFTKRFTPRKELLTKNVTIDASIRKWGKLLQLIHLKLLQNELLKPEAEDIRRANVVTFFRRILYHE